MDFQSRRDRLRKALKKANVDALLVTDFTNVTYLTGFTGDDSYLLVRRDGEDALARPEELQGGGAEHVAHEGADGGEPDIAGAG